jgi:uncharacterized protein
MSTHELPIHFDPFRFARDNTQLEGSLSLSKMDRLSDMVLKQDVLVHVSMRGFIDELEYSVISGSIRAVICLECQRCLLPFEYELESTFSLTPITKEEEAEELPNLYDGILCQGEHLQLKDIIEEELILHVPFVAKHELEDCAVTVSAEKPTVKDEIKNPFATLKNLRR